MLREIIKTTIKKYLNESNFLGISSFNDIDDNKIIQIIDNFGYEGYYDRDEAIEDFEDKVESWKNFSDPVTLYRVIGVEDEKAIRTDDLGEHWTQYEWNLGGDMLLSIGYELWDEDIIPYVIKAEVSLDQIDIKQTIIQNLSFPNEHEINLKNKGKNIKFIEVYKLEGY